jgi:16S rRNA processing protein RimM
MDLFVLGEVVKTRGLRGCIKVLSFVESQAILDELDFVYIEESPGQKKRYNLKKIDRSGKFIFIELVGISDIDAAQEFVGRKVLLPKDMLEQLPDGEYYWRDIIGLNVYSDEGKYLGLIDSVFPTGSNDVYVCKDGKSEILLPAIAQVILQIDLDQRKMIVKLLDGL